MEYSEEQQQKRIQQMEVGDRFVTRTRVISRTDAELFAIATGQTHPMFLSEDHAREYGWPKQIVPGLLSYSVGIGLLTSSGFLADVRAYMATDKLKFVAPLFVGQAIKMDVEVLAKKKTSKGHWICTYRWFLRNDEGKELGEGENTVMIMPD